MAATPEEEAKTGADTPELEAGTATPSQHHHHPHFPHPHAKRFTQFIHPHNGKTVHVCRSPEHLGEMMKCHPEIRITRPLTTTVEQKKTELLQEKKPEEFDVLLQGSSDHLEVSVSQLTGALNEWLMENLRQSGRYMATMSHEEASSRRSMVKFTPISKTSNRSSMLWL